MPPFRPLIVQVISEPDGGGAQRIVRQLVHSMAELNFESKALYFHNARKIKLTDSEIDLDLCSPYGIKALFRLRRIIKQLSNGRRLIVHAHLSWPLYFVPMALMFLKIPIVFTEHNTHNRRREIAIMRPIERLIYAQYHRIACISLGAYSSLSRWLARPHLDEKLQVIVNGSRLLTFFQRVRAPQSRCSIIAVGTLCRQKGFDVALKALALLNNPQISLTILGEGPDKQSLIDLAVQLGISENVELPGFVDDIEPFLHRADLAIMPSRWEGFGLVAVESLSTGLPIVASNVDGLNEVLADCKAAYLVQSENPEDLARGISMAFSQLVGDESIAIAAREHAAQFDSRKMVLQYATLYESVLAEQN